MATQYLEDPFTNPQSYDKVKVAGLECPGIVPPDGISGFSREIAWDVKKGKGTKGGSMTLEQLPPAKGSIKFLLWTAEHARAWDEYFRALFKYDPTKKKKDAIDIYHPALAKNGVYSVVTEKISPETYEGPGLYSITVDLHEYLPPPKKTVTSSPAGSSSGGKKDRLDTSVPSEEDERQRRIAELMAEARKPI